MAEALTVSNVNIAAIMGSEAVKEAKAKFAEAMEANPVMAKLLDAAESVEDAYQIAKKYIAIKFEDFRILFDRTVDYFKESKVQLDDAVMDTIVGGGWWSNFWAENKRKIIEACIVVGCTVVGVAVGAVTGGVVGAMFLGTVGASVGMMGIAIYDSVTGN